MDSTDIFAGLTRGKCPDGCRPDKCLISGDGQCLHPVISQRMTAYHSRKPEVVARYEAAVEYLAERRAFA